MEINLVIDPTNWLEATWTDGGDQVRCVSYHPTQIAQLRADSLEMGVSLDEHEALLADWVSSYDPPAPEPEPAPAEIHRWQGTRLLKRLGLWDSILFAHESMPEGEAKDDMHVALFDTITWRRSSPSVAAMAYVLGVTDLEVDDWFIEAATYEV